MRAGRTIAVVLKGYPRLSETFIAQELLELERAGFRLRLYSMRHPTDRKTHPVHDEIQAPVTYLPEYLHDEPLRVLKAWRRVRRLPGYAKALRLWLADLKRDFTRNRFRRFGQALVLAAEIPDEIGWLYSHFIHTPGSVARYAHVLTGLSWSCSAHAKDIWTSADWELSEKLASAEWTVTCTGFGHRHLQGLSADPGRVHLVYHGLDLARFPPFERPTTARDGRDPADPVQIVTVGRAVPKKGLDTLVDALARLPADLHWHWTHIGGGELADPLRAQVMQLGLDARVTLLGSQPQDIVLENYRSADLFVLPSRIAADGDRDGLPNVLVEAASQGLACISTPISGIVELIQDDENGRLVPPDDPDALAAAIAALISDPAERDRLGRNAAARVRSAFDHRETIGVLVRLFDESGVTRLTAERQRAAEPA
ncbi:MAG TPA: glycosyltransferase family 4 protein [Pararhizobium sp.]|nr:glycosyltransferase family 4 protein [Pararhizobium sp.]